jgi:hypothetical protein
MFELSGRLAQLGSLEQPQKTPYFTGFIEVFAFLDVRKNVQK